MRKRIGIIGGSCVDIFATSALPLIAHDSNPGRVNIGFGGVGRNIAENLARLNQEALLIAPFGQDPFSTHMLEYTTSAGVHTEHSIVAPEGISPYYISINDAWGEMSIAISDLEICNRITPDFLLQKLSVLNACDAIIMDTNIPKESIDFLASHCKPPLFAETVSTRKATRLASALPHLHAIKANLQEAGALIGKHVSAESRSLQEAANHFHGIGVPYIFITMGKIGAFFSNGNEQLLMEAYQIKTLNANGCGDAFGAMAFLGILMQKKPKEILQNALTAAAITAQSPQAVSMKLSLAAIEKFIYELRNEQ